MGGRKRIGTVGPLVFLASAASVLNFSSSLGADLTISSQRTTPADTTTGDGAGPGNIVIQTGNGVTIAGDAAVTINSSNAVTSAGSTTNNQESNATAILALTTKNGIANDISGSISNLGAINVPGPASNSSVATTNVFNSGIRISGLGTFTGNVTNDRLTTCADTACTNPTTAVITNGTIVVGGNGSTGMFVQSTLIGTLSNLGTITVNGDRTTGIAATGRIVGNFVNNGSVTTGGTDAVGVYVGGGLQGAATIGGLINAGTGAILTSTNGVNVTTLSPTPAKAGLWLASDVTQGVLLAGNQITLANEAANPTAAAAVKPADSNVVVVGGPGILVTQGGLNTTLANITIGSGTDSGGYSIRGQGNIQIDGTVAGLAASAINIRGTTSGASTFTTTLTGGLWNDKGNIQAVAQDAQATGISIGNYGLVSRVQNDGDILVNSIDSTSNNLTGAAGAKGGDAYGILVDPLGSLPAFNNSGHIIVTAQGSTSTAYGVVDRSGTLTSFTNSGLINTVLQLNGTGSLVGVDLKANTSGVTFTNSGTIIGDVLLGAGNSSVVMSGSDSSVTGGITFQSGTVKTGNNSFSLDGGTVFSLVSLGNGTHTVSLSNGAKARGGIAQGTGTLVLSVDASQLKIFSTHPINASSATVSGASTITFEINNSAAALPSGILQSTGTVNVGAASKITAEFTGLIDGQKTITAIRAGSLVLGAPLSQLATSPNSYINATAFSLSPTDSNTLLLTVRRKSAAELGLGPNTTAIYNAFTTALNQDVPLVTEISTQQTAAEFNTSIRQLMPDTSGTLQQAALNNQDMASGAIRRRLVGVAKNGMPDHAAGDVASFWTQALGDFSRQKQSGEQAGFDIWGLGIAIGADLPVFDNTTNLGISFTETWHSADLKISRRSPVEFYNTQVNFYGRYTGDSLYLQATGGGGYNSYSQKRQVNIGSVSRIALGAWKGYEYGGTVEAGFATRFSAYELTPYVRAAYLNNHENGYTETSGGTGVNLTVGAIDPKNARASAGFTLDRDFPIFYDSYVEAEFRANYTREFMNDPYRVTAQFSAGPTFTNTSNARSPNRANAGVGLAHKDSYSSVSLDYDAEIAKGYLAHKIAVTARFRF